VFCEIQEPVAETVRLIEDIVRGQLIELVSPPFPSSLLIPMLITPPQITRARLTSHLRASRYLAPEDLIFLIRDDRAKVNRLRTYLSWKEVRKNAKKDDQAARGGADIEVEDLDDVVGTSPLYLLRVAMTNAGLDVEKKQPKKQVIKLPWELITPFQDLLRNLPNWSTSKMQDEEDNDDEELEAYEDSIQRLRVCANH
jgi:transcription initiation protein SPT3